MRAPTFLKVVGPFFQRPGEKPGPVPDGERTVANNVIRGDDRGRDNNRLGLLPNRQRGNKTVSWFLVHCFVSASCRAGK